MTLQEILNAHRGHIENELNKWRRVRWQAAIFANVMGDGKKTVKPSDLMTLPGDDDHTDHESDIKKLKEMRKWREQEQH